MLHLESYTLDEYLAMLQELRSKHGGGLLVQKWASHCGRYSAHPPKLAYTRVEKPGAKPTAPQFYQPDYDDLSLKGEAVIRI